MRKVVAGIKPSDFCPGMNGTSRWGLQYDFQTLKIHNVKFTSLHLMC